MASFTVYRLYFTSPLHIGDNRLDYGISLKTIQSDTLYAAIISNLVMTGQKVVDGDLGCTISSLFPFYQKGEQDKPVYFFPKPLKNSLPVLKDLTKAKQVKKVAWLDKEYFQKLIHGKKLFADEKELDDIKGLFLTKESVPEQFVISEICPRVTVSRTGKEDAVPFYMDRISYKDKAGLFFMAEGDTSLLDRGLKILKDNGIGTDRNVGNGFFEYEVGQIELDLPDTSDWVMALSMFIPESEEELDKMLKGENVAYDFMRRGGWITTPPDNTKRKNVVYAFVPASVFAQPNAMDVECKGKIVDLNPQIGEKKLLEHPIWRCGKSIFIPCKI